MIPIIGVNESGKTTILKAILAFDKSRDKYNSGEHLSYQNLYLAKDTKNSVVTAQLGLDSSEFEEIIVKLGVKTDSEEYKYLQDMGKKDQVTFDLCRTLSSSEREYELVNLEILGENTRKKLKRQLEKRIPVFLYFDDFTDRVPETITFSEHYIKTGQLRSNKLLEWQEILQEIFRRADSEGLDEGTDDPLKEFIEIDDADRRRNIIGDIEDELNRQIIDEWRELKKRGNTSYADHSDTLQLSLSFEEQADNTFSFSFKVDDRSKNSKRRTFNVTHRSKGFQWFFNYMMKLKFNPRYKNDIENSIFLLDEPGSYLHSAAQVELLQELKSISESNYIIYCTHSQFLLDPTIIKLGSVRIADKNSGVIFLSEFGTYKVTKDFGALSVLYQSLRLNPSADFPGKVVLVEGITDFYFLKMLQMHSDLVSDDLKIIPGLGAGQSATLIALAIGFSDDFIVLLDSDKPGRDAVKKYVRTFDESIRPRLVFHTEKKDTVLEDLLSSNDSTALLKITSATSAKSALGLMYFDYPKQHKEFISNLTKTTLENLKQIIKTLDILASNEEE